MSKFDFNEIKKMRDKMGKALLDSEINNCLNSTVKELGGRIYAGAIRNTIHRPNGTGRLKKGWDIKVNGRVGNKSSVDIFNDVEYAIYVEKGHRTKNHKGWVEGKFMLEKSEMEVKKVMPKIIEDKVKKLLKGGFK